MLKENPPIENILHDIYGKEHPNPQELILPDNPLKNNSSCIRPNSAAVEDCSFGDSGKGHIVQELNDLMIKTSPKGTIYSERWNGTRNAGHEIRIGNESLALHQLPIASVQEGATAIIGKGMLVHPEDLITEIKYAESKVGGRLPSTLLIDQNAIITTDLHSAFETYTNKKLDVGHGTTGSGVAQGYASWYEKRALTVRDFASEEWRDKFAKQYVYYADLMGGVDNLSTTLVSAQGNQWEQ